MRPGTTFHDANRHAVLFSSSRTRSEKDADTHPSSHMHSLLLYTPPTLMRIGPTIALSLTRHIQPVPQQQKGEHTPGLLLRGGGQQLLQLLQAALQKKVRVVLYV